MITKLSGTAPFPRTFLLLFNASSPCAFSLLLGAFASRSDPLRILASFGEPCAFASRHDPLGSFGLVASRSEPFGFLPPRTRADALPPHFPSCPFTRHLSHWTHSLPS